MIERLCTDQPTFVVEKPGEIWCIALGLSAVWYVAIGLSGIWCIATWQIGQCDQVLIFPCFWSEIHYNAGRNALLTCQELVCWPQKCQPAMNYFFVWLELCLHVCNRFSFACQLAGYLQRLAGQLDTAIKLLLCYHILPIPLFPSFSECILAFEYRLGKWNLDTVWTWWTHLNVNVDT